MNALPSKKQHALLEYIDKFIEENSYAPSYREVMRAFDYKSVSTVATHINGLIERGWLVKRDNSARSVEVVYKAGQSETLSPSPAPCSAAQPAAPAKGKLSEKELVQALADARAKVEVGGMYVHYKGGSYTVIDVAIQTEDDAVCVVYQAQYGDKVLFTRPLSQWLDYIDGASVRRFEKAADQPGA